VKRLAISAAAVLSLAGCGSSQHPQRAQPKLPARVANQLAAQSDRVAAALDRGDACRALDEARRLQQATVDAINAGRVPAAFQEQLGSATSDLLNRIVCVRPPPAPTKEHGHGKGKHKGKHEGGE
jgi:hypothetical protein